MDRVTDVLRADVLSGRVAPGVRLPPERELAATLGVNRQTLRAALARLESEGLVAARQGSGITVLDWRRTAGVSVLPALLAHGRPGLLRSFLELRRAVAVEAVAAACVRAPDAALDELEGLAHQLAAETDLTALTVGNLTFAARLLELADNLPMQLLFHTVAEVYEVRPELRRVLAANADAVRASFPAIVALLRQRDPARARAGVRHALEALDAATLAHLEAS